MLICMIQNKIWNSLITISCMHLLKGIHPWGDPMSIVICDINAWEIPW
jgi:hypothetical protein